MWNAEGLGNSPSNPKVADIVRLINKQNIKLVCLVETWWDGDRDAVVPEGWQGAVGSTYWTNQGNVRRGIAVWWKTGLDVTPLPDNCFSFLYGFKIRGQGKGNDLVGAVVYLSFRGDEKETREVLQWARKWAKQGPVMILGDFNTGAAINKRLVEALRVEVGLIDKGAGNRGASTTKRGTRIDRLLVIDQVSAKFTAPLPLKDMTTGSYHYPCVFSVEWDLNSRGDRIVMPRRAHATKLTDLDDRQLSKFSRGLAALVVDDSCIQLMSETITAGLVTLANKVVAKRDSRVKLTVRPDKQIASLVAQKNATARREARARKRGQADMSAHYGAEKKRITREIQSRVGMVRRELRAKLREKLAKGDRVFKHITRKSGEAGSIPAIRVGDTYVQGQEAVHLFAEFYRKPEIGRTGFDLGFGLIVARTLSSHLQTKYQSLPLVGTLNTPPDDPELIKLLASLKANKAAGHDDLSPSVLKADPQGLVRVIGPLFRRIWEECVFPEEWGLSDVSPIPKEGKARDIVDSYRPIYLIPAMCKLFSLLLTSRITQHIETHKLLGEEHMGFRRNKGCEETAATLWELLSIRKRQGSRTFVGFLDLSNAFPTTWREGLFTRLFAMLGDCRSVRLAHALYQIDRARVRMGLHSSEPWRNRLGVKTGDPLSPILFLVFMHELSSRLKVAGHGIHLAGFLIPVFLYADDIALLADSAQQMQAMLFVCEKWAREYRMIFSLKKCEIVEYGAALTDRVRDWDLQGGKVLEGRVYKYLGILFHQSLSGKAHAIDVNSRIRRRIGQLKHVVLNEGLQLPTARKVIIACVASVLEYGSLSWFPRATKAARSALDSRWNLAIKYAVNVHNFTHSAELRRLTGLHTLEDRWLLKSSLAINKISKLEVTSLANRVLSHRIEEFTKERKHPWGCWLAATLQGLRRVGLGVLAEDGFEQLRKLKAPALRAQLVDAIQESSERAWVEHSQLKGKRVQRLLLPKPGGCDSIAVILTEGSFSLRKFASELACNSLPLHGESPARFSVIPPLGKDTSCPVCKHANEDLAHFLLACPGLDRPPDWPKTIRSLILLFARSEQDLKAAAEMWRQRRPHAQKRSECPPQ